MVGLPEGHADDVRYGETQKADGAAVGGHCSGQEDGRCEDAEPCGPDVESHGAGVVFAQQQHVERLDKRYGEGESRGEDGDEYPQFGEQHPSEASHRPYHIGFHGPFGAHVLKYLDDCGGGAPEHHAHDEYRHDIFDAGGDGHDDEQDGGCSHPCGAYCADASPPDRRGGDAQQGHAECEERHAEACAGTDAEDIGACQRIAEEGLHLQSDGRERCARKERRHRFGNTEIQDDVADTFVRTVSRQAAPQLLQRNGCGTDGHVGQQQQHRQHGDGRHQYGGSPFQCPCGSVSVVASLFVLS